MPTALVYQALARPVAERAKALLELPEDQWLDRKSPRIQARDLAKTMVAMANAEGGVVIIGLHDGRVEGIGGVPGRENAWRQAAMDHTVPTVPARLRTVACIDDEGARTSLAIIEIETSDTVHSNRREEVHLRVGDEDRRLSLREYQELLYDKGQSSYEATPVRDAHLDELDRGLLGDYTDALGSADREKVLRARGLVSPKGELTIAAILLFGEAPQARFPEAAVRVLRYAGSHRGVGARQQLVHDRRCEGPIPRMLGDAQNLVHELLPTRRALGAGGRFEPVGIVPRDAWLEGLVNAVVHRFYSMSADQIRVEIFDDRLEIESPGRFPGLVRTPEDPRRIARFARNPRIARVCADLAFGQELGEGIPRIYEEMRLAGLAAPEYVQTSGSVRLTLAATPVDVELERRLPTGAREIVRLIRQGSALSTGDVMAALDLSRPVVRARLRALEDAGVVEWVGKSARDPRAFWRLARGNGM